MRLAYSFQTRKLWAGAVVAVALLFGVTFFWIGRKPTSSEFQELVKSAAQTGRALQLDAVSKTPEETAPAASSTDSERSYSYTNRLSREISPYLLMHAHNPVDWYPWSKEAFEKARSEGKPIFLSVGYAACHW